MTEACLAEVEKPQVMNITPVYLRGRGSFRNIAVDLTNMGDDDTVLICRDDYGYGLLQLGDLWFSRGLKQFVNEEGRPINFMMNSSDVPGVSRIHAGVVCYISGNGDKSYSVRDFGSKNGTYVNGVKLGRSIPPNAGDRRKYNCGMCNLNLGDVIAIGNPHFRHTPSLEIVEEVGAVKKLVKRLRVLF